jgi:hypothetical protein
MAARPPPASASTNPPVSGPPGASSAAPASSSTLSIPQTAAAGGISFTEPKATATSFYKISPSETITFGWNITSLSVTPTHFTVSAYCASNGNTYSVGPTNGIIDGTATQILWNPATEATPIPQGTFTLFVQDERGLDVAPSPGYFSPNKQLIFALYSPQPYTPLSSTYTVAFPLHNCIFTQPFLQVGHVLDAPALDPWPFIPRWLVSSPPSLSCSFPVGVYLGTTDSAIARLGSGQQNAGRMVVLINWTFHTVPCILTLHSFDSPSYHGIVHFTPVLAYGLYTLLQL